MIDRQEVIEALNDGAELLKRVLDNTDIVGAEREKYEWGLGLIESYISDIKELPSAQPEVLACGSGELNAQPERTGRWEQVEINYFADMDEEIQEAMAIASMFCPMCKRYHNEVYLYGNATYGVNFCPNCGVDMRGEKDGN